MPKLSACNQKLSKEPAVLHQVAALPFRIGTSGTAEILVITSRETSRFVIPKGWPKKSVPHYKSAAREAFEEAGLVGKVKQKPIGAYSYWKRLDGHFERVNVDVYPIEVRDHRDIWPEKGQRKMAWLSVEDAASLIEEPDLSELIRAFKPKLK